MLNKIEHFLLNTSLHGFKYFAHNKSTPFWKRIFAKIFWSFFMTLSMFFLFYLLKEKFLSSESSSTSINFDTSYHDWNNTFPAISICFDKGRTFKPIQDSVENYFTQNNIKQPSRPSRYFRTVRDLFFLNPQNPINKMSGLDDCREINETCGVDIEVLRNVFLPQDCHDFIKDFEFLEQTLNCSDFFFKKKTESGLCFVANSLYDAPQIEGKNGFHNFKALPLKHSNLEKLRRRMLIRYIDSSDIYKLKVFVHSPEEGANGRLENIPIASTKSYVYHAIKTIEMINQDDVFDEEVQDRHCRFPSEKIKELDIHYSSSNCIRANRMLREIKNCGCVMDIGVVPKNVNTCGLQTLVGCIANSSANPSSDTNELCSIPSCLAMEISVIGNIERDLHEEYGTILIEVLNKPTLRYVRRVKESKLDRIGE